MFAVFEKLKYIILLLSSDTYVTLYTFMNSNNIKGYNIFLFYKYF